MQAWILRRYKAGLVDSIDQLIGRILAWEDNAFSAEACGLTTSEAQEIASHLIQDLLIASFSEPLGIDGEKLLSVLQQVQKQKK